jgi:hypothetical protein
MGPIEGPLRTGRNKILFHGDNLMKKKEEEEYHLALILIIRKVSLTS